VLNYLSQGRIQHLPIICGVPIKRRWRGGVAKDGDVETLKASRGKGVGRGVPLPAGRAS